nr:MAG TPA: hypothetical protein [Caudoviricetes sp.]
MEAKSMWKKYELTNNTIVKFSRTFYWFKEEA